MQYIIHPHKLIYNSPFRIAHTIRDHTLSAYLELISEKGMGVGEVVFPPYYQETLETFTTFMKQVKLPSDMEAVDLEVYMDKVNDDIEGNQFGKAALDIGLHNLKSKLLGTSIANIYNITGKAKATSYTIGISSNEEMVEKIEEGKSFEYIKLKVDQENIDRITENYVKICDKTFVVDANQGFTSKEKALESCEKLSQLKVAYLEQPFLKDDLNSHRWLKERSPIPIIADESFQQVSDISRMKDSFDGINIKLMKCGGLAQAFKCFQLAKEYSLKTVLGCMSESSVAIDAANELAPLADWVDLDGAFLIKPDSDRKF